MCSGRCLTENIAEGPRKTTTHVDIWFEKILDSGSNPLTSNYNLNKFS